MFLPPYEALLAALGTNKEDINRRGRVSVPKDFFDMLLRLVLSGSEFDESKYLAAYPDVAGAVKGRKHKNGRTHFLLYGYFEGRLGGTATVDEDWYRKQYPDVDAAIKAGTVPSAAEHYRTTGVHEWRLPNSAAKADIELWKRALGV